MIGLYQLMHAFAATAVQCLGDAQCETDLPKIGANDSNVQALLQVTFAVIGATAVIIIIVAALKLIASQGNPQEAATARQTIVYAAIGLAVAISAEAIVTFVLTEL